MSSLLSMLWMLFKLFLFALGLYVLYLFLSNKFGLGPLFASLFNKLSSLPGDIVSNIIPVSWKVVNPMSWF